MARHGSGLGKPDASGSKAGGIVAAHKGWFDRDQLVEASRPGSQIRLQPAKVRKGVMDTLR